MTKRTGGSTNAAPSALKTSQAQSETGGLPKGQVSQSSTTSTASTEASSQPASTVATSQVKPEVSEKQDGQVTATGDTPASGVAGPNDQLKTPDVDLDDQSESGKATDQPAKKPEDAASTDTQSAKPSESVKDESSTASTEQASQPAPKQWILRVCNSMGSRLYEPYSNTWLEAHQDTEITSASLSHHNQVKANVQELSRLKKGRVEIIND